MPGPIDPRIPDLPGFTVYDGVPVASIGEDGGLVALGHYPPDRVLAAFNQFTVSVIGLASITDDAPAAVDTEALLKEIKPFWAVQRQLCATFPHCGSLGPVADGFPCHDVDGEPHPAHLWGEWSDPSPKKSLRRRDCDNCDARELLHPDGRVESRNNPCGDCVEVEDCGWYLEWDPEPNCPGAFPITLWRA